MIDASHDFIKDGNKNRLRERDISKIVDYFTNMCVDDPKYARFVMYDEFVEKNKYNLNIPRYIDNSEPEDLQDISAHLLGGIPKADVDKLDDFWHAFCGLREILFSAGERDGYFTLNVSQNEIWDTIFQFPAFQSYAHKINNAFYAWKKKNDNKFYNIAPESNPKMFIVEIADSILNEFIGINLIDHYDIYETLMNYWEEAMQDDVYAISYDGYEAARDVNKEFKRRKDGTITSVMKDFEGRVIPKKLIVEYFFKDEQKAIFRLETARDEVVQAYEALRDEHDGDEGLLSEVWIKKGKFNVDVITKDRLKALIKLIKDSPSDTEELAVLERYFALLNEEATFNSAIKTAKAALEQMVLEQYPQLTMEQIKELLIEKKWSYNT